MKNLLSIKSYTDRPHFYKEAHRIDTAKFFNRDILTCKETLSYLDHYILTYPVPKTHDVLSAHMQLRQESINVQITLKEEGFDDAAIKSATDIYHRSISNHCYTASYDLARSIARGMAFILIDVDAFSLWMSRAEESLSILKKEDEFGLLYASFLPLKYKNMPVHMLQTMIHELTDKSFKESYHLQYAYYTLSLQYATATKDWERLYQIACDAFDYFDGLPFHSHQIKVNILNAIKTSAHNISATE